VQVETEVVGWENTKTLKIPRCKVHVNKYTGNGHIV